MTDKEINQMAMKIRELVADMEKHTDIAQHPENYVVVCPPGIFAPKPNGKYWFLTYRGYCLEVLFHEHCPPGSVYVMSKEDLPVSYPKREEEEK